MRIDIGIEAPKRKEIANGLAHALADTYTLYLKTHNFHWNVTGPMFIPALESVWAAGPDSRAPSLRTAKMRPTDDASGGVSPLDAR